MIDEEITKSAESCRGFSFLPRIFIAVYNIPCGEQLSCIYISKVPL